MPKNIFSKREDLICGKIDLAEKIAIQLKSVELLDLLQDIRFDAERMEQKLILRKQEFEKQILNKITDKEYKNLMNVIKPR